MPFYGIDGFIQESALRFFFCGLHPLVITPCNIYQALFVHPLFPCDGASKRDSFGYFDNVKPNVQNLRLLPSAGGVSFEPNAFQFHFSIEVLGSFSLSDARQRRDLVLLPTMILDGSYRNLIFLFLTDQLITKLRFDESIGNEVTVR